MQKYRRLVLEKHPDKQPGNKKAAEEFIKIQRAYEIITDEKAREAWAALQRSFFHLHTLDIITSVSQHKSHNPQKESVNAAVKPSPEYVAKTIRR